MARVHVLTNTHAATSPRVVREADALAAAGHEVTVSGVWLDDATAADDAALARAGGWHFVPAADLRRGVARLAARATRRAAQAAEAMGRPSAHALVYAAAALRRAAVTRPADALRLHLEAGVWIGAHAGPALPPWGVDMEDWHSENDPSLPEAAPRRRWLAACERAALRGARHVTTTSHALAHALASACDMPAPAVVPNVAPTPAWAPPPPAQPPRLLWISQTVGRGRGLEPLCDALRTMDEPWELTLAGHAAAETRAWITAALGPQAARVRWQPFVRPWELDAVVAAHHVGLALEVPTCRNKDLTASNKLFHALQGGLHVVATDTAGQREMLGRVPGHPAPVRAGDVPALRDALRAALAEVRTEADPAAARRQRRAAAAMAFPPDAVAAALVDAVARLLTSGRTGRTGRAE